MSRGAVTMNVLMVVLAASLTAQAPVNLSGTWTIEIAPSTGRAGRGAAPEGGTGRVTVVVPLGTGWGSTITLTQDAASLTVTYQQYERGDMQPPTKRVYQLNGSESRNLINVGRGPQEEVAKAVWSGNALVITTTQRFVNPQTGQPAAMDTKRVLSLDAAGALVIETTYAGAMGGEPMTSKAIYKKS